MCGIFGWLGSPDAAQAEHILDSLSHRGPDGRGVWRDELRGVWLGHRRLSIIDLSVEGHQPMLSPSGRYVIIFNGEVYNFEDIRAELDGRFTFRGHSDTEVMLAAIETWGLESAVKRFVGMFAFALWDREEAALYLVRDRVGIKPLYWARSGSNFAFASELSALRGLPWLDTSIDPDALDAYFRYLCVPAPATIIRGARKLMPGTILRFDGQKVTTTPYWDLKQVIANGTANRFTGAFEEASQELEALLNDAVKLRMIADVPLGAFLSGGVDSSTVVALMQQQSSRPILTFTIGFDEESHDESHFARSVAQHLGTEHSEDVLTADRVLDLIPRIGRYFDEPFADGSSVPTYLLSEFTRKHVTVSLSGDGGDELFAGYPRYFWASRITNTRRRLGASGARLVGNLLMRSPAALWDMPARLVGKSVAGADGLSARVRRFGSYLAVAPEEVYAESISAWPDPQDVTSTPEVTRLGPSPLEFPAATWAEQMMAVDQRNYLVDDILTKVDRSSMAVSLEARVPLLDHRIVEFAWRLPPEFKMAPRGDRGKLLLRDVLHRHVPRDLIERPKKGFGMPMSRWLRGPLRTWAEDWLAETALVRAGLSARAVRRLWSEHLAGEDRLPQIWTVLMYVQWHQRWHAA